MKTFIIEGQSPKLAPFFLNGYTVLYDRERVRGFDTKAEAEQWIAHIKECGTFSPFTSFKVQERCI